MAKNTTNQNRTKAEKLSALHIVPTQNITNHSTHAFLEALLNIRGTKEKKYFL